MQVVDADDTGFLNLIDDGSDSDISVLPASLDFGSVPIGSPSFPQTITVSNTGASDLMIETISVTGPDAQEFHLQADNCSGQSVEPSGSCMIDLIFSPTLCGSRLGNLSISSNDPDTPTLTIPLYGTGVTAGTFLVTSVNINLPSNQFISDQEILANGTISGYGTGYVSYQWQLRKPDDSEVNGPVQTVNMINGSAVIPNYSLRTDIIGTWQVKVRIIDPSCDVESNPISYEVISSDPDLIPPGNITDLSGHTGTGLGAVKLTWTAPGDDGRSGTAHHNGAINTGETDPSNPSSYTAQTTIHLKKGFNLIAIPADVTEQPDFRDWLPMLGDSSEIEKVMVYDDQAGIFITLIPGDSSNPSFTLNGGEGLIVYAKQDKEITFTSVLCSTLDLKQGVNLVGFVCPANGYSAYQLIDDLGSGNVSSIQRYSTEKGAFETASFEPNGQLAGIDFTIISGEGYFIFMKQTILDFR